VVATIAPLADLARDLGGGLVDARALLPPGANPHAFEFRPGDVRAVWESRVVLEVGGDFEPWVDRAVQAASRSGLIVVRGLDHVATRPLAFAGEGDPLAPVPARERPDPADEAEGDHGHGPVDPHFWLDPRRMAELAPRVTEAFARADSANGASYRAALAAALDTLEALDREIEARLAPCRGVSLLALHATWGYFSDRYGLRIEGVLETFPGQEPGPMTVAALARRARASGVRAIVAEPQQSTRLASVLAAELGVPVLLLDPLGGEGVLGRETYAALLRWNARELEAALSVPVETPR
jgi:ABC-type Zn uptake system ZnuABC Zn-binding protein ZnuA